MLVDSHCHLNLCEETPEALIARAKEAGVCYMQTIATNLKQVPELLEIASRHEGVFVSAGVHPCSVKTEKDAPSTEQLLELGNLPKVIGFGETGLDYYHPGYDKTLQQRSLLNHIEASSQIGLPLIIHTRDADEDTGAILSTEYANAPFKGLIHCFTADISLAKKVLDFDFYISISGIITFKNAAQICDVVRYVPLDRLLIETDTPYLSPVPMRGKPNEPAFVGFVAEKIAELKGLAKNQVAEQTTNNFFKLFNKAVR